MRIGRGFREQTQGDLGPISQDLDHVVSAVLAGWRVNHNPDGSHADIVSETLTNAGFTSFGGRWELAASAVLTPSQIVADQNNYNPPGVDDAIVLRLSSDAARTITGLRTDKIKGRWLLLSNVGNFTISLPHNNTSSSAQFRFACPSNATFPLPSAGNVWLWYDSHSANWRIVANVTLLSGTYTPTLTNVANLDGSTAYAAQYSRVGNTVTVTGKVDVDPTAGASTQLGISLPIASNFANAQECAGVAFASGIAGQGAAIQGDATNNRAEMVWVAVDTTNQSMFYTFSYQVI